MSPDTSSRHTGEADKNEEVYVENSDDERHTPNKATAPVGEDRINVSDADNSRILRRTDVHLLTLLCWVYFLQILDKSVIGYSAVFGLKTDAHLVGNQYSTVGSIGYYAQLGAQPLGAYLLVKLPIRGFLSAVVLCWGASLCGMAGSTSYHTLLATRFLLGFFEAACLPAFSLLTASWYRRHEQPLRVAAWYSTNGIATALGSLLVYGLGHVHSKLLFSYQIIFLVCGLITVVTVPLLYFKLDNSVADARFLTPEDRLKGVERLRANNTGIESHDFKISHIWELFLEPKTYLFLGMSFLVNTGSSVSNVFGPLILQGIAGFSSYDTTLLNIPFGVLQFAVILGSSYVAVKTKTKSTVLACFMIPVVIGSALLYTLPHTKANEGPLLLGYYLLSFLFAGTPIIIAWITANTAGQTKKAAMICAYNAASSGGNILGPNLFLSKDAPDYKSGLQSVLAIFCVLIGLIGLQNLLLRFLNKRKEVVRVKHGKRGKIHDASMDTKFDNTAHEDADLGANAFSDLTDVENDEFVYVL